MLADETLPLVWDAGRRERPFVVTFGNEKGGVGKTTLAMHLAVALAAQGRRVATVDADGRQGSLSRYLDNRTDRAERTGRPLPGPARHVRLDPRATAPAEHQLADAFRRAEDCDVLVVDTPGAFDPAGQAAHANADLIVTPVSDSFMDLDALARIDVEKRAATAPSAYTKTVWKQANARVVAGHRPADWIVVRNRMSPLNARNKRDVAELLQVLAARIGFRALPGISERLVFRELFYAGLTVTDLTANPRGAGLSPSQRKAAEEIAAIVRAVARAAGFPAETAEAGAPVTS